MRREWRIGIRLLRNLGEAGQPADHRPGDAMFDGGDGAVFK
jgi:hypothetical protein